MQGTRATPSGLAATRPLVRHRLAAYILDVVLVTVVGLAITYLVSRLAQTGEPVGTNPFNPGGLPVLAISIFSLVLDLGYFTISWRTRQRTLGMQALGLWISDEHGDPLSYRQAVIRWTVVNLVVLASVAVGVVVWIPFVPGLLAYAWYFVLLASTARSATNQGLHDRAAGSVVTSGPASAPPPSGSPAATEPAGRRSGARRRRPSGPPP